MVRESNALSMVARNNGSNAGVLLTIIHFTK